MENMKLTIVQHDIVEGDCGATLRRIQTLLDEAVPSDVYVLQEMFATGFDMHPEKTAQTDDGETVGWMRRQAARLNAAVVGSVAIVDGDACYNRLFFVAPEFVATYDKRHLFSFGGEKRRFSCGCRRVVVDFRGVRFLLQTCYDLRFPVFSRSLGGDYDVALYPASWPTTRITAWDSLLTARAIENQAYVVGVNRVGRVGDLHYNGHSRVVDFYGRTVASTPDSTEAVATVDIDAERCRRFRIKFPALEDADAFTVQL